MKIHIVGCSGSGKTCLADILAEKYSLTHIDLDDIQFDNSSGTYGIKNPPGIRDTLLKDALSRENRVTEGIYYAWNGACYTEADTVILLKPSRFLCVFRIIRRFIRRKLGKEKGKRETVKGLLALIRWTKRFYTVNLKEIEALLAGYPEKTVILTGRKETDSFVKTLPPYPAQEENHD